MPRRPGDGRFFFRPSLFPLPPPSHLLLSTLACEVGMRLLLVTALVVAAAARTEKECVEAVNKVLPG